MSSGHGKFFSLNSLPSGLQAINVATRFDYLFKAAIDLTDQNNLLPQTDTQRMTSDLVALARAMVDTSAPGADNSPIPAIYTYWGQFIDHDITLQGLSSAADEATIKIDPINTTPIAPSTVLTKRINQRRPELELDSVYGDGPKDPQAPDTPEAADFYNPDFSLRLEDVDITPGIPGQRIPPIDDLRRDLVRDQNAAPRIGDARNDENLVVAQFHVAVIRFHNAALKWVADNEGKAGLNGFIRARDLTRWHYQWLVINDYLKTVCIPSVIDDVFSNGPRFYDISDTAFMPCEFSDAAFRFGHSMIRNGYDHNRNFGPPGVVKPFASLEDLFRFTGGGGFRPSGPIDVGNPDFPNLPFNWVIEWPRFTDRNPGNVARKARRIDTRLAPQLLTMFKEGEVPAGQNPIMPPLKDMLKHLAMRNLLRGYLFSLPTGQAVARALATKVSNVSVLTRQEIEQNNAPDTNRLLNDSGMISRTPLWYYVLKEAEVREGGNRLGQVGSYILAETFVGLLKADRQSFVTRGPWDPSNGVKLPDGRQIRRIEDFLAFAGVFV